MIERADRTLHLGGVFHEIPDFSQVKLPCAYLVPGTPGMREMDVVSLVVVAPTHPQAKLLAGLILEFAECENINLDSSTGWTCFGVLGVSLATPSPVAGFSCQRVDILFLVQTDDDEEHNRGNST